MLQNATPLLGNQRADLLTSLMNMSLVLCLPREISFQILFKCPTAAIVFGNATKPSRFFSLLTRCTIPCACDAKRHLNVQKWSESVVFLTFWLRNVLRATTACTFSTSQLRKVVWTWCALYILTSKCASRHNCAQFFISHPASWLRTRRFSLLFDPPEPQIIGKIQCFATFLSFRAPGSSFFWDFLFLIFFLVLFSSLTLTTSAFHLSMLSEVWLLNFFRTYLKIECAKMLEQDWIAHIRLLSPQGCLQVKLPRNQTYYQSRRIRVFLRTYHV